ncbi:MAG TPA: carboxypeptidase-like regulatory domain-containing protein [Polyangia bacterium]|nr:carboxypeptidase-like regulatory domain-containing protein [Polyangia bacterium]
MEIASRRGSARALILAGLAAALAGWGCGRRAAQKPAPDAAIPAAGPRAGLAGRVTDAGARAVPGARVLAVSLREGGAGEIAYAASTDGDGRFQLNGLPVGAYALVAEAVGLAPRRLEGVPAPGPEVVLALEGLGRSLEGLALAGGAPVGGARVRLAAEDGALVRETTSGSDGRFVFHGLGVGGYSLRATHDQLASATAHAATSAPRAGKPGAPVVVTLALTPGFAITGGVVDDRGRAVGGVEVRAEATPGDPLAEVATASAGGAFRFAALPAGAWRLVARAPGLVARAPATVALGAAPVAPVRLELVRAAVLSGRVVDARGLPIAGAEVRCVGAGGDDLAVIYDPLPLAAEAAALPPGAGHARPGTRTVVADGAGTFRLSDLVPGTFHLEIARPPSVPLRTGDWTLAAGEARDVGALVLRDGAVVGGRVVDDGGRPVAGARVDVAPSVGVFAETDDAGAFALTLPAGHYTLAASAAGGDARVAIDVGATPPALVELRLVPAGARLDGLVRDSGARPVARARVRAFVSNAAAPPPAGSVPVAHATTDAGGHFVLTHVPERPLVIEVDHADYPPTYALAPPGALADVTLPIAGAVDGVVREHVTGAAVARARVEAAGPGGQRASATSGAARAGGGFRLGRLTPGHWTITATAPGFVPTTRELDVPASAIARDPSVRDFRLELDRAP